MTSEAQVGATSRRFALHAEGSALISREPKDILEFVLDLERYRLADQKLNRIYFVKRNGNTGLVRYSGQLWGIPTPAETQEFHLTPYSRLEFWSVPSRWPGLLSRFAGLFTCEPQAQGTMVFHSETVHLARLIAPLAVSVLGGWFQAEMNREVHRLKTLLETGVA